MLKSLPLPATVPLVLFISRPILPTPIDSLPSTSPLLSMLYRAVSLYGRNPRRLSSYCAVTTISYQTTSVEMSRKPVQFTCSTGCYRTCRPPPSTTVLPTSSTENSTIARSRPTNALSLRRQYFDRQSQHTSSFRCSPQFSHRDNHIVPYYYHIVFLLHVQAHFLSLSPRFRPTLSPSG